MDGIGWKWISIGFDFDWIGLDWVGLDWIGFNWIGVESELASMGFRLN